MSKLSKKALKSIVKECLVEILAEGIIAPSKKNTHLKQKKLKEVISNQKQRILKERNLNTHNFIQKQASEGIDSTLEGRRSYLDNINYGNEQDAQVKNTKVNNIVNRATSLSSDPMMQSIFADTAKTTLQEQITAESRKGSMSSGRTGDAAARHASKSDPLKLFGGASQNWATLAFGSDVENK